MDKNELEKALLKTESPFTWEVPCMKIMDHPPEQFLQIQKEKVENLTEENEFQWTSFTLNLLLAYEYSDKKRDHRNALKHINLCLQSLILLTKDNCTEELFHSLRPVLSHVTLSTKAHIHLKNGDLEKVKELTSLIKPIITREEKAGVLGVKAALYIQYGIKGHRLALECAKKARDLDPDQAEWYFLVGNALGRIRRIENGIISIEEINSIEKAFALEKNASYTVLLGQLYGEYSSYLFYNSKGSRETIEKSKMYASKAVARFKEAIEMRPNCASLKARVAHGLLRIRCKEMRDTKYTKQLLDEVVKMTPHKAMVYHDLGYYYEKFENNVAEAIKSLQRATELGNIKAASYLITLKWKHGLHGEILRDINMWKNQYSGEENQSELMALAGACYLLIEDDWPSAIACFKKCLANDISIKYLENYASFAGNKVNMLELITNEVRLKVRTSNSPVFLDFLVSVKSIKPELFYNSPEVSKFGIWKQQQLQVNVVKKMKQVKLWN